MKTLTYFFLFFLSLIFHLTYSQDVLRSKWYQPEKIIFPDAYNFDAENDIFYYLANDEQNLYVYLVMVSDASQIRAMRYGLTIFIDPEAKSRKKTYIKLLAPENDQPEFYQNRTAPGADREVARIERRKLMVSQVMNAEISGFGLKKSIIPVSEMKDISCQIQLDDQVKLNYIFTIPLTKIADGVPLNQFSFGIETGSLNMDQMPSGRPEWGAGGGRPEGAMGERPAGIRPGSGERPGEGRSPEEMQERRASMQKLMVPIKVWVKSVSLAEAKY